MSNSKQSKKDIELRVLEEALAKARERGGESRRLVDRIHGEIHPFERPDFLITPVNTGTRQPTLIGVEHFRVDHFSEYNAKRGNQDSLVIPMQRRVRWIADKLDLRESKAFPNKFLEDMAEIYGQGIEARMKAGYPGFIKAMSDTISKHAERAEAYRKNVEAMANGRQVKLAFLIELHSDFSDVFVNDAHRVRRLRCGEPVFFVDMRKPLEDVGKKLDYLVLAFYPAFTNDIQDAMVVNCCSMNQSFRRNRIEFLQYFGTDKHAPVYAKAEKASVTVEIENCGNGEFGFSTPIEGVASEAELEACIEMLALAIGERRSGSSFAAELTIQMLIDVFGDTVRTDRKLSFCQFAHIRSEIGDEEVRTRVMRWQERWLPDTASN